MKVGLFWLLCVAILTLRYDVTSLYTLFLNCPDRLFDKNVEKNLRSDTVSYAEEWKFMYLFRKLEFPC